MPLQGSLGRNLRVNIQIAIKSTVRCARALRGANGSGPPTESGIGTSGSPKRRNSGNQFLSKHVYTIAARKRGWSPPSVTPFPIKSLDGQPAPHRFNQAPPTSARVFFPGKNRPAAPHIPRDNAEYSCSSLSASSLPQGKTGADLDRNLGPQLGLKQR
ncbi:hypothetical protein Q31a_58630 [Aureliella helgolandensis]|uniref:Uncharacterized protein n=1 Tax=Aureliella helgolandensis TaxID=2527968 RepID=A0A518GFV0_9BACT|nr:hypothetical protein Q31a_58630 [Aureliella helgolandensis]